ncbi:efflux RND transporter periplasmic adaptor subunit [Desulfurivibrio dismutans]|uniref:efflux RND transporter periplasmic adaptor subunit n=1 Tax=Desulfurivibrio dismutans TaxID=1398908 RepID=UPI0023DC4523|nr:efflux RND transporter periplasmic adaptor subunit [Desulfurivibrio alkaliphilus]MDF1614915.1 efflux RND transporter periplasmic adaptor subunit [Desulfurivibrio alkaliphilus]
MRTKITANPAKAPLDSQQRRPFWPSAKLTCAGLSQPGLLLLGLLILPLIFLTACAENEQNGPAGGGMPPPTVTVTTVSPQDVLIENEYPARVHGSRRVEVRARVGGILEERLYREGATVAKDEPLFLIDPEPFEIAWRQAKAEQAAATANLNQAQREWRRTEALFRDTAISARERDQALANLELTRARLELAEAMLADAARNRRYTEVTAPIAGITELEVFTEGSLVEPGTLLTTITSLDPVHVRFSLPEEDAAARRLGRQLVGNHQEPAADPEATLLLPDGRRYDEAGKIDFTAGTIDPRTGTVTGRAIFANPDQQLVPGQFVRIRLALAELTEVFLIPAVAVGGSRNGAEVFVVDGDDIARARKVELGPIIEDRQVIISGLAAGDRLVINGLAALRDGMPVQLQTSEPAEQTAPAEE